ncbi:uncharacterized protein PHALS_09293 [Plasmopara halstedii]|uniref:Uncharacterized protein n=1 Tax=Plasmopara halstedii TaxID=4781 RepID=A0A0P1AFN5_PLAHL|nr:uncharacterized protein PHALS_09293 [Plasmopara halstedii]CEG39240.1 hypothetical protein PHALS_09293 [Plasmopara halstedii]|eukprot:XP_024575609.1 hypothetical protein PHALS_09293 [Plasmopara halstedii]
MLRPAVSSYSQLILAQVVTMEAVREMIGKPKDKGKQSKSDDDSSFSPKSGTAYRSSEARGEPDIGTTSYSRDDRENRHLHEPVASSRDSGSRGYSRGTSGSPGLGGERSGSGYTGDSNYENKAGYSNMGGSDNDTYSGGSSDHSGRRYQSEQEYSRRSDEDD